MYATINLLHDKLGKLKENKEKLTEVREINISHVLKATTELQYTNEQIDRLESDLKKLYSIQNPPSINDSATVSDPSMNSCGPATESMPYPIGRTQ